MKKKLVITVLLASVLFTYLFVPVHKRIDYNEYINKLEYSDNMNTTRYFLKYVMGGTGVCWHVQECSDESMIDDLVMVRVTIDPRFLNINKYYALDMSGVLIVETNRKEKKTLGNENVWCIYPEDMYIYMPEMQGTSKYYIRDISIEGILKAIIGVFYWPWRYSY